MVLERGHLFADVLRRERVSVDDPMTAAPEQGVRRLTDVDPAVLEADGRTRSPLRPGRCDGDTVRPLVG